MANPNPSPGTRFASGNPGGGKTAEQKRLEYESAEMAAKIRHKMLSVITEKLDSAELDALDAIKADILRLIKDSEDRAHGTPKTSAELSGPDGAALFEGVKIAWAKPDEGA